MPVDIASLAAQAKNRNLAAQVSNQSKKITAMGGKPHKGGPSILSRIFDVVSRPMYGVMEPLARATEHMGPQNPRKGKNILADVVGGFAGGLAGKQKTDFGEVMMRAAEADPTSLTSAAIRGNKYNIRSIGGIVGDIGLDPLSYTGGGLVAKAGKAGAKAAGLKAVEEVLTHADTAAHLEQVGKEAVKAKSVERIAQDAKALTTKEIKKVTKKAIEEESLKLGKPAYEEAYKAATTDAPGKVQLKFGVGHNKKVIAESEKLYSAFGKPAELIRKSEKGAAILDSAGKKFSTKALLPEDLKSIARRRAQAGVKEAENHAKKVREFTKDYSEEGRKMAAHAIEEGNQEIPEHLREFVTSTEKRAAVDVAKSIESPLVAKAAGIARSSDNPVEAVSELRKARQHLGKMIENVDDVISNKGWQDWVRLQQSTPQHLWKEAERLDKEVYQAKRGVQGVAEAAPLNEKPFGPEDIVPGSGGGRPSRTFSEIAKGPAKTKTVEEVTGVAPKIAETAPVAPVAPPKIAEKAATAAPKVADNSAKIEEIEMLHMAGAIDDAERAKQLEALGVKQAAPEVPKTAPGDPRYKTLLSGPYAGTDLPEANRRIAQAEEVLSMTMDPVRAEQIEGAIKELKRAVHETLNADPVKEAANKAQASLSQIVEKIKKPTKKALAEEAKAKKAAGEAAEKLKSVEKRISNHEKIIKDLEDSIKKNEDIVRRAESKSVIDEVVQRHIDSLKIADGPLKGKTVKEAEALVKDLDSKIKATRELAERERLIKMRKQIEGSINKAKESVVGPKVKKVLSEQEKVALDKAKAALKEDKPLLEDMKDSLKSLHGKKKDLAELASKATPSKNVLESLTEFMQGGKGLKELPVGTRRTEIGAMHGPPVPEGALHGPGLPATTKQVLPEVAKQAEKVPEVVRQAEKVAPQVAPVERELAKVAPTPKPEPGPLHGPLGPEAGPFKPSAVEKIAQTLKEVTPVDDLTIPSLENLVKNDIPYRSKVHGIKDPVTGKDLGALVDFARDEFRKMGELEVAYGLHQPLKDAKGNVLVKAEDMLKDDYVYHYYHKGGKGANKFKLNRKKILGGDIPTYAKERKLATLKAAKEAGLKPEEDLGNILALRIGKHYQSMARRHFVMDAVGQYGQKVTSKAAARIAKDEGMVELRLNGVPNLKNTYVPATVAASLQAVEKAYENPQYADDFIRFFDRVQSHWKFSATALNPGHHTRNMVGDMWNSFIGGVSDPRNWGLSGRIMKDPSSVKEVGIGGMKLSGEDLWRLNIESGAAPGFFSSEFGKEFTTSAGGVKRKIVEMGEKREEFTRFGYFIGALRQEGAKAKNMEEIVAAANRAGERTRKWLVDYGDVTEFESKIMKRAVPFYTWSRKNIPLQLEALMMSPGRIATIPKAQTALQRVLGTDSGYNEYGFENLPKWLKEMAPIRLTGEGESGHSLFGVPALPFQDVSKFTEGGKQGILQSLVSQITPVAKIPIEQATGEQLFSGAPIKSDFEYFGGQVPMGRLAVKAVTGKLKPTDVVNWGTGAGVYDVGPEQVQSELRRQQDPLQAQIRNLRASYKKKMGVR